MSPRMSDSDNDSESEQLQRFSLIRMDVGASNSISDAFRVQDDHVLRSVGEKQKMSKERSVHWSETLTEETIIESARDFEKALRMRIWYEKADFATFEFHDFEVFVEFREVFRGARIEQCEEWFVTQRDESLRGLENLDDMTNRKSEVQKVRHAVIEEQDRQRQNGITSVTEIAKIAEEATLQHCEVAHGRGKFDEELVERLLKQDLRKSKDQSKKSCRSSRLRGTKTGRKETQISKKHFDNDLEDDGCEFEGRSECRYSDSYIESSISEELENRARGEIKEAMKVDKKIKPKKKRGFFTIRVKKR